LPPANLEVGGVQVEIGIALLLKRVLPPVLCCPSSREAIRITAFLPILTRLEVSVMPGTLRTEIPERYTLRIASSTSQLILL
jgi:hypothetical protein